MITIKVNLQERGHEIAYDVFSFADNNFAPVTQREMKLVEKLERRIKLLCEQTIKEAE
jgi:hypothetical protein